MKKVLVLLMVAGMISPAFAGFTGGAFVWNGKNLNAVATVKLENYDASSSNGGAFWVNLESGSLTPSAYSSVIAPSAKVFSTYCVEEQEGLALGLKYFASIDKNAYAGGIGAAGDPISNYSEWIYDKWLAGNPSGWSQSDISHAIWHAEGEYAWSNAVYDAAVTAVGAAGNATHTWALNLWSNFVEVSPGVWTATEYQSHLITVPAPGALLLGSMGMALVGWLRRRQAV